MENLAAFRDRLLQNCNAHPATQKQISKNLAHMRGELGLNSTDSIPSMNGVDGAADNKAFLMVLHLAKSSLVNNPTSVSISFVGVFRSSKKIDLKHCL